MSSDIAIKVENLSKCYQIYEQPRDRLKQFVMPRLQRGLGKQPQQYYREFWALKDVSFEVKKGETVGIIGRNGSGKSTLLQIICGTLNPTVGTVTTHGRIAALLELGSGFNPDFTGRENVYMNAAVLGLSNDEIDQRFDAIAAFADIGEFIEQPVKTYSSGMMMRLAFAVSIYVDPTILVVDEALAVGDIAFQHKCFQRIRELRDRGVTILFVSHDLGSIAEFCMRALVLNNGVCVFFGSPVEAVNRFKRLMMPSQTIGHPATVNSMENRDIFKHARAFPLHLNYRCNADKDEYGDGAAMIFDWGILGSDGCPVYTFDSNDFVEIVIFVRFERHCASPIIGYFLSDAKGREIVGTNTLYEGVDIHISKVNQEICVRFKQRLQIAPGEYFLNIGCSEYVDEKVLAHHRLYRITSLQIFSPKKFIGFCRLDSQVELDVNV